MISENSDSFASTTLYPWSLLAQLGLETLAFAAIAVFCLLHVRGGPWAWIGLAGGAAGAVSSGVYFAAYGQIEWLENASILEALIDTGDTFSISQTLSWLRVIAVVLVAVAFMLGRRPRSTQDSTTRV